MMKETIKYLSNKNSLFKLNIKNSVVKQRYVSKKKGDLNSVK